MTEATRQKILEAKGRFARPRSAILSALYAVQDEHGYVDERGMEEVARLLNVPYADVAAVASFYTMLFRRPVGRYVLDVCRTISCELVGSRRIVDHISRRLGIRVGETTADGLFTLREVECLGDCGNGPVMQVGDKYYEKLTPESVDQIIEELRAQAGPASSAGARDGGGEGEGHP